MYADLERVALDEFGDIVSRRGVLGALLLGWLPLLVPVWIAATRAEFSALSLTCALLALTGLATSQVMAHLKKPPRHEGTKETSEEHKEFCKKTMPRYVKGFR